MKKSRFSEAQIVAILKEVELGAKVGDTCRKHGISDATYYKWKSQYSGMLSMHENVGVVVSSSWRQFLKEAELAELLASIRPWFAGAVRHGARDEAIREYVNEYAIEDFAVLDDVLRFFPGSWPQLILCNPALGLSEPAVQQRLKDWLFED